MSSMIGGKDRPEKGLPERENPNEENAASSTSKRNESEGGTPQISGLRICSRTASRERDADRLGREQEPTRSEIATVCGTGRAHYLAVTTEEAKNGAREAEGKSASNPDEMYRTLEHAVVCLERECAEDNCHTLKQFFVHLTTCDRTSNGGCMICFAFDAMVCQHSKACRHRLDKTCPVPKCDKIRSKVIEEWGKLKAKHGQLMRAAFCMLSHARLCGSVPCRAGICCNRMKQVVRHANHCHKKADCQSKNFLFSLCQHHQEICTNYDCPVDFCQEKFNNVVSCVGEDTERSARAISNQITGEACPDENSLETECDEKQFDPKNGALELLGLRRNSNGMAHPVDFDTEESGRIPLEKQMEEQNRKSYPLRDSKQIINVGSLKQQKSIVCENALLSTSDVETHERSPTYGQEVTTNIFSRSRTHWLWDDRPWWHKEGKDIAVEADVPIDYACLDKCSSEMTCCNKYEPCSQLITNHYTLWPCEGNNRPHQFSPTQLQNILMGKDLGKRNGISSKSSRRASGEKGVRKTADDYEAIPTKVILLDEAKAMDRNLGKLLKHEKTLHCARRLFPTNETRSPGDSESDSDFCKNLSQGSSSQSENSEWAVKA